MKHDLVCTNMRTVMTFRIVEVSMQCSKRFVGKVAAKAVYCWGMEFKGASVVETFREERPYQIQINF